MRPFDEFLGREEVALVSCCNVGHGGSRYCVAVVTADGIDWLNLDSVIDPTRDKGITGITSTADHCFLAVPGERERIISLDRYLQPVDVFDCSLARDLHSLAVHENRLYFASTGCNQVLSISCVGGRFEGPEQVHVTRESADHDQVHLNSLLVGKDGSLMYSMFGVGPRAPVRAAGAVVQAQSDLALVDGLMDPHSLTRLPDGRIALCESMRSALCIVEPQTGNVNRIPLRGYTRGIAHLGRHLLVGASHWRSRSRSSHEVRGLPGVLDAGRQNQSARAYLFVLRDDLTLAHTIDFTPFATEIYDLAFLGRKFQPAAVFRQAAERRQQVQKMPWGRRLFKAMRGGSSYGTSVGNSL